MDHQRQSLQPVQGAARPGRRRLGIKGELALALLPTVTMLVVLGLVQVLSRQQVLFASLASSAFLIYLDPQHGTNTVRTLVLSQMLAAGVGFLTFLTLGPDSPLLPGSRYLSGGVAMVATIVSMILLDAVHPPAVATSLAFAFRAGDETNVLIFGLAVAVTAVLVVLQRSAVWLLARYNAGTDAAGKDPAPDS